MEHERPPFPMDMRAKEEINIVICPAVAGLHLSVAGLQGGGRACGMMAVRHKSAIPC